MKTLYKVTEVAPNGAQVDVTLMEDDVAYYVRKGNTTSQVDKCPEEPALTSMIAWGRLGTEIGRVITGGYC